VQLNYKKHSGRIQHLAEKISKLELVGSIELLSSDKVKIEYQKQENSYEWLDTVIDTKRFSNQINFINSVKNDVVRSILDEMKAVNVSKMMVLDDPSFKRGQVEMRYFKDAFTSKYYKIFLYKLSGESIASIKMNLVNTGRGGILAENAIWYER
jgi:hypothetical protein